MYSIKYCTHEKNLQSRRIIQRQLTESDVDKETIRCRMNWNILLYE